MFLFDEVGWNYCPGKLNILKTWWTMLIWEVAVYSFTNKNPFYRQHAGPKLAVFYSGAILVVTFISIDCCTQLSHGRFIGLIPEAYRVFYV